MATTTIHNIMVRDKVPAKMIELGVTFGGFEITDSDTIIRTYVSKMRQVLDDVEFSTLHLDHNAAAAAFGTMYELLDGLGDYACLDAAFIGAMQSGKRQLYGGFNRHYFLEWTEDPEDKNAAAIENIIKEELP